ncbi:cytochrome P450 71A1-like, partial [Manihot esculenta]|uniref:cytochrome P450 71A1-like n=1 Tax=Manihot esculenta TaxID=3983 RepID=UPI001CC7BD6B
TVLDILLQLWKNRSFKVDLTFDHIKAVLMNVFVGGTDTGAATVVWAMTLLMKNPITMKKAQEEIRKLVGKKGFVEEDDVQQLPYLKAVIKETMRLQPTVPLLVPRESTEDCVLDGYDIPAKTVVYVNAWAIGRDPEIWKNPEELNPERLINSSIDLKGQDFELTPFGAGRRICPGIFMGLATVEVSLANLLYKFDWEMPVGMKKEDLDMVVQPGITMHKKNALCLMARKYL